VNSSNPRAVLEVDFDVSDSDQVWFEKLYKRFEDEYRLLDGKPIDPDR